MTQAVLTPTAPRRPMGLARALRTLARNDARLIGRDSFLTGLVGYILAMAVLLRFALPWLAEQVAANPDLTFSVPDYYPLMVGYICLFLGAVMAGVMVGFIALDERDDRTLVALLVTPLPLRSYLAYRMVVPMVISFALIVAETLIINQALVPLWQLVLLAAGASTTAPVVALFFATFAENKVQGFALNKIVGVLGLLLLAAWFIPEPFQYLVGLFPPYWIVKAYWLALDGNVVWPLLLIIGAALNLLLAFGLARRFRRIAYRSS